MIKTKSKPRTAYSKLFSNLLQITNFKLLTKNYLPQTTNHKPLTTNHLLLTVLLWLVAMLPIVEAQANQSTQGNQSTALFISTLIPDFVRSSQIDIAGRTLPGATITINVNSVDVRKSVAPSDSFVYRNVALPLENNTIILIAELNTERVQQQFFVVVDGVPPRLNISVSDVSLTPITIANITVSEQVNLTIKRGNESISEQIINGTNPVQIQLLPGQNNLTFVAKDRAGLTSTVQKTVLYDTGPPRFLENNLNKIGEVYSNLYDDKAEIKGKLSEQASVTVFVNGNAQKTVLSAPDGTFSITAKLERKINASTRAGRVAGTDFPITTGTQWPNQIKLQAVDFAGLKSEVQGTINLAQCGSGSKIDVRVSEPFPDMLNPRLLVEGLQQLGIAFNYTYRGGYNATILTRQINVKRILLSPEFARQYDNNLVTITTPQVRSQRVQKPTGEGYLQINFPPIDDPWSQLREAEEDEEESPGNPTTYDKEKRLSEHRKDECLAPGLGCMKLFLELEIPFQEVSQKLNFDPLTRQTPETINARNEVQRTCLQLEVPIDVRVPPKVLPNKLLNATSEALGNVIDVLDDVLGPLQTIGEILFYTCTAGTVASAVPIFFEKYNCQYKNFLDSVTGEGKFDEDVAAIGVCDTVYAGKDKAKNNCKSCQDWKEYRAKTERAYRQVCDRIFCPSAPSLQYYLKTKGAIPLREVAAAKGKFVGSDCAKWIDEKKGSLKSDSGRRVPPRLFFTYTEIQDIYNKWLQHKDDEKSKAKSCAGLHAADADCCGYEYMQEWSSACGVSAISAIDTFDEIKESTCLSAEKANQKEISDGKGGKLACNSVINAASGFCEKDGGEATTTIPVVPFCCETSPTIYSGKISEYGLQGNREKQLYVLIVPQKSWSSPTAGGIPRIDVASGEYDVELGYLAETIEFDRAPDTVHKKSIDENKRHTVSSKLEGIELNTNIRSFFTTAKIDAYHQNPNSPQVRAEMEKFRAALCTEAGYGSQGPSVFVTGPDKCPLGNNINENTKAKEIYEQIMASLGTPDKEYIVRPGDGLINSARCVCLPTLTGYVKQWKNIMTAVRNCVNTIMLTGDGEPGVCQAVISQYACDLLYDAVSCFTQKFSVSLGNRGGVGPFGDIIGALTSTGTELARSVEGRYGESNMYKAVFVDRKLVHSVCMFAFTGTWNFDLTAAFDKAVEDIPIESQALLTPCTRRFASFNPATQPKGLVTWIYNFGVGFAAGADADVELHLKCSGGYKCREIDGFARGKCDCDTPKDIVIAPQGFPTQVKKGSITSEDVFHRVEGAPDDEGRIRWDSAYLVYRWHDGTQYREEKTDECKISLAGGVGTVPSFCRFDPSSLSFRCQFGDVPAGISFLKTSVGAKHKIDGIDVFALNEPVNVTLDVRQEYPAPVNYKNNKFLEYTIRNQNGIEVERNERLPALSRDGDYIVSSLNVFGIAPVVKKSWFEHGTETANKDYKTSSWTSINPNALANGDGGVIFNVGLTNNDGRNEENNRKFILELTKSGAQESWALFDVDPSNTFSVDDKGIVGKRSKYLDSGGLLRGNVISYSSKDSPQYSSATVYGTSIREPLLHGRITITLADYSVGLQTGETRQILIDYKAPGVGNPCTEADKPNGEAKPQRFTITYTAFDADQFGERSDQISVDPSTEQLVQKQQPLLVVCASEQHADFQKKIAQSGNTALSQKLVLLNSLLERVKDELGDAGREFKAGGRFADVTSTDPSKIIALEAFLKERYARDVQLLEQLRSNSLLLVEEDTRVIKSTLDTNIKSYENTIVVLERVIRDVEQRLPADRVLADYARIVSLLANAFTEMNNEIKTKIDELNKPSAPQEASSPATSSSEPAAQPIILIYDETGLLIFRFSNGLYKSGDLYLRETESELKVFDSANGREYFIVLGEVGKLSMKSAIQIGDEVINSINDAYIRSTQVSAASPVRTATAGTTPPVTRTAPTATTAPSTASGGVATIRILANGRLDKTELTINVGDKVRFVNEDSATHVVSQTTPSGYFPWFTLRGNSEKEIELNAPGEYTFVTPLDRGIISVVQFGVDETAAPPVEQDWLPLSPVVAISKSSDKYLISNIEGISKAYTHHNGFYNKYESDGWYVLLLEFSAYEIDKIIIIKLDSEGNYYRAFYNNKGEMSEQSSITKTAAEAETNRLTPLMNQVRQRIISEKQKSDNEASAHINTNWFELSQSIKISKVSNQYWLKDFRGITKTFIYQDSSYISEDGFVLLLNPDRLENYFLIYSDSSSNSFKAAIYYASGEYRNTDSISESAANNYINNWTPKMFEKQRQISTVTV